MKSSRPLLFQLFPLFLLISLFAVIALGFIATNTIRGYVINAKSQDLLSNAKIIRQQLSENGLIPISDLNAKISRIKAETGIRITVIDLDGKVVADTDEDTSLMDNHGDRPEIMDAYKGGTGFITRFSHTLQTPMLYVAIPFNDREIKGVIRTSMALYRLQDTIQSMQNRILISGIIVILLSALFSFILSKRITNPLKVMMDGAARYAKEDFSQKIPSHSTDEIGGLAISLNNMAEQLHDRIEAIRNHRNELEAVLSSMIEGVLAIDHRDRVIRINSTALSLLEINIEPTQGVPIHDIIRHTELLNFIIDVFNSEDTLETNIVIRREKEYYLQVTGTPLVGNNHQILGALFVFNDISRIRKLEKSRSDFVGNVSHELKTPITAIQGFVETLKEGAIKDTEKAEKFIGIIERQSNRLGAIVEDLLQLSRIEREYEEGPIETEKTLVAPLLESVVRDFESKAQKKNITLNIACGFDMRALLNLRLMHNAINNLVDNALKYSDDDTTITLSCAEENGEILICVKDEGSGISEEHFSRLFERFYRVDKGRSRSMGGTGLGLAIVKHIVLAHNGRVSVESHINEGSTFTIALPSIN